MGLFGSEAAPPAASPVPPQLADVYKHLLTLKGKSEANALTNNLASAILAQSVRDGASDVHFDPHDDMIAVRFRIDGELRDKLSFSRKDFAVTAQFRVMSGFSPQAATSFSPEDGAFSLDIDQRPVRFRVSAFPTIYGDKLVIRLLDSGASALTLDTLGFTPESLKTLKAAIASPSGIFFVCGITGGGKTTTLCSIVTALQKPSINIMTLEDPVEYVLPHVIQSNINPKAGFNFADGLRSILRQDPNIIMLGEVRDAETAEIAMRAALTGHLIFSTIHTISTVGIITRLTDMGIPPFLTAESMIGALAQRLVRKICAQCAAPVEPSANHFNYLVQALPPEEAKAVVAEATAPGGTYLVGRGCPACNMTGYKGRTGIFELLTLTRPLRELIAAKTPLAELRRGAISSGLQTLLMDGIRKARAGITTLNEIARVLG